MKKGNTPIVKKAVFLSIAAILIALAIALPVMMSLFDSILVTVLGGTELNSEYQRAGEELSTRIEEEGIVMVKNDDDCLPLKESDVLKGDAHQVNVFGWAATDWIMGGSGSGRAVNNNNNNSLKPQTDLLKALNGYKVFSEDGIQYNTALTDVYTTYKNGRNAASTDTLHSHDYESCVLYEPELSSYAGVAESAVSYSDVALVVIGRISGESNDAPKVQYKYKGTTDESRTYLDISTEEEELLEFVGSKFEKVVVIINSTNTMNLEFMDRIDGLDACLIVGGTGNNAANAIPNVLFGKKLSKVQTLDSDGNPVLDEDGQPIYEKDENGEEILEVVDCSPSGRTVDTYAYDFKTNANYAYSGMDGVSQYVGAADSIYPLTTTNPNVGTNDKYPGVSYLDYAEGIYVGYKWYETADTEGYWNSVSNEFGQGYDGVVQYPFGYGLSYTKFEWYVKGWELEDETITATVEVKNIGDVAGQEVVQMYFTPYYAPENGIEKASVNLCAFAKTLTPVEPGETSILTLSFNVQDMASYVTDIDDGAYLLEKGDYEISLRTDCHTVAKVEEGSATYTYNPGEDVVYNAYYGSNGTTEISNVFSGDDVADGISVDGSDTEEGIENVWLSRADFEGTFKKTKQAARNWNDALNANNLYDANEAKAWDSAWEAENGSKSYSQGQNRVYTLYENGFTEDAYFFGNPANIESEEWETLLNQLTIKEMEELVLHGYIHEEALPSIGKPQTVSVDGPAQAGSFNVSNAGVGYPMSTVLAQTWNSELAKSFGFAAGGETRAMQRDGWYAPGVNLHRSAFGGRNYEYYSEDSYLSGIMCASTVRGALNAGVYTYIKHLIGYDQESYRDGLYCWMTEQTLRETYLSPFKRAIDEGATGLMTSYGRIGSVWAGGSESLLTDLLRHEWGFNGTVLSDYSDHQEFMSGTHLIRAGGDLWMDGFGDTGKFLSGTTSSLAFKAKIREAAKHVIYTWTNAAYEQQQYVENGGSAIEVSGTGGTFHWWWLIVAGVDVVCIAGATLLVVFAFKKPRKSKEIAAETSADTSES